MEFLDVFQRNLDWKDYHWLRLKVTVDYLKCTTLVLEVLSCILFWLVTLALFRYSDGTVRWYTISIALPITINSFLKPIDLLLTNAETGYDGAKWCMSVEYGCYVLSCLSFFCNSIVFIIHQLCIMITRKKCNFSFLLHLIPCIICCTIVTVLFLFYEVRRDYVFSVARLVGNLIVLIAPIVGGILLFVGVLCMCCCCTGKTSFVGEHHSIAFAKRRFFWTICFMIVAGLPHSFSIVSSFLTLREMLQYQLFLFDYKTSSYYSSQSFLSIIRVSSIASAYAESTSNCYIPLLFQQFVGPFFFISALVLLPAYRNVIFCRGQEIVVEKKNKVAPLTTVSENLQHEGKLQYPTDQCTPTQQVQYPAVGSPQLIHFGSPNTVSLLTVPQISQNGTATHPMAQGPFFIVSAPPGYNMMQQGMQLPGELSSTPMMLQLHTPNQLGSNSQGYGIVPVEEPGRGTN